MAVVADNVDSVRAEAVEYARHGQLEKAQFTLLFGIFELLAAMAGK